MTSLPRPTVPSREFKTEALSSGNLGKSICVIVGLTCLAGFTFDMLVLGTPPTPLAIEWRVGLLQQMGDRSIVLLLGVALLLFGTYHQRGMRRTLGFIGLVLGVAFLLSCVLVIRDSLTLQNQAISNISTQEQQLQAQIDAARSSDELPENITLQQLEEASQQLVNQAETSRQDARRGITKAGTASMGNLVVVGLGLIGLGRLGLRRR